MLLFFTAFVFILSIEFKVDRDGSNLENYCNENSYSKQTVLVLGARVYENGKMSGIFEDRVLTALNLYKEGKVEKILVSGDHGTVDYNEVGAAKDFLLENGVDAQDIFLDHAGFDTYDSVYRAKKIFEVESLVIVTQDFHLPRAHYIAQNLDLDFCGKSSDLHLYKSAEYLELREKLARVKAWLDITLDSKPKYLGETIYIGGDGRQTWE